MIKKNKSIFTGKIDLFIKIFENRLLLSKIQSPQKNTLSLKKDQQCLYQYHIRAVLLDILLVKV